MTAPGLPRVATRLVGIRNTTEFETWRMMISRCYDERARHYCDYGGRGIRVCERWRSDYGFDRFMEDMGPHPGQGYSLGRVDNARGYEPGNCRWETWIEQANNRRGNRRITIDGVTKTAAEWARFVGVPRQYIISRLNKGWHPTAAVLAPKGHPKRVAHETMGLAPLTGPGARARVG